MKNTKSAVTETATELQNAYTVLKSCRTAEANKERAFKQAREARIKAEEKKEAALKAHNESIIEMR